MKRIILSRTDSIGDVVLTLPMAGVLKERLPGVNVLFLGSEYTRPVIDACTHIDEFINWDSFRDLPPEEQLTAFRGLRADVVIHVFPVPLVVRLAKRSGIPVRIATAHRSFTLASCNRLLWFSRSRSVLHEAQLNLKLLEPLGIDTKLSRDEIPGYYGLEPHPLPAPYPGRGESGILYPGTRFRLILHPKSRGSAREWGAENFSRLIGLLPEERFEIFVTGTEEEGHLMRGFLEMHRERVTDMTGRLTLPGLMDLIRNCDGMVAASTGPLHLAAAFGKTAVGLFAPMRPIWPSRWAPLGKRASYLVHDKRCSKCRRSMDCECMRSITPEAVASRLTETRNHPG